MDLLLRKRAAHLAELMDDPHCDAQTLINTYTQFETINRDLSQWPRIYRKHIRPVMRQQKRSYRLLDIGFGGGDVSIALAAWAEQDGFDLSVTGVEMDARSFDYVQKKYPHTSVDFRLDSSRKLAQEGQKFDFVVSNHVLHHLSQDALKLILEDCEQLATHSVIFNDINRHAIAYYSYGLFLRPFYRKSFIIPDGLTSIRRSYTASELASVIPSSWRAEVMWPFRLLLRYDCQDKTCS
jgi:2-polyprenyl-3-methyl-5-hydroxy-6-metoxy-1,4-benzoquinol methylase